MKHKSNVELPNASQIEKELSRERYKRQYRSVLRSTVYMLITVAAVAILVATLWLPVLRIYGESMSPGLNDGDIVVSVKTSEYAPGDVICFYYNNKILVKRVIALPGDWVDMDADGNVYVNGELLEEPYLSEKSLGNCDITFPYQVPEARVFVMGDHRSVSIDSRTTTVGCVAEEQVVGKLILRIWPFSSIGLI